eukprot:EG_transcript_14381
MEDIVVVWDESAAAIPKVQRRRAVYILASCVVGVSCVMVLPKDAHIQYYTSVPKEVPLTRLPAIPHFPATVIVESRAGHQRDLAPAPDQKERELTRRPPLTLHSFPNPDFILENFGASNNWKEAIAVSTSLFAPLTLAGKFDRVLTPLLPNPLLSGITHAWLLSVILWFSLGWQGWAICVIYLFLGVAVTKVRSKEKEAAGIAEGRGGARGPENVWGSAATAAACALAAVGFPAQAPLLALGYVASLATKLSDTCGSEIGKAFGKTPILITTLQQVPPGTEGAVSVEGTVAGIVGSAVLALFGLLFGLITPPGVGIVMVAAFIACNFESFLGATIQGKVGWMTNEVVNAINTTVGAVIAAALALSLGAVGLTV